MGGKIYSHKLGHERNLPDQDCDHIMQLAMDSAAGLELADLTGAAAQVGYPDPTLPTEEMQIHVCALLKLFLDNIPPPCLHPACQHIQASTLCWRCISQRVWGCHPVSGWLHTRMARYLGGEICRTRI